VTCCGGFLQALWCPPIKLTAVTEILVKLTAVTQILVKLTAVTEILVKLTAVTEILVKLTAVTEILVKLTAVTEILVKLTAVTEILVKPTYNLLTIEKWHLLPIEHISSLCYRQHLHTNYSEENFPSHQKNVASSTPHPRP
jgi:hypothetical protein